MKKSFLACLVLKFQLWDFVHASIATVPNQLLGGLTVYNLRDYENLYDSAGNVVTNRVAQVGDTVQGVFVVTQVSNQFQTADYAPSIDGAIELTGVFDEYVSSVTVNGGSNFYYFTPDATLAVGSGTQAKFMSGSAFQAAFGNGSMIAVYSNNQNAMPSGTPGNGLVGQSTAGALALATSGSKWATFGANGNSGAGYYWQGSQQSYGSGSYAASLGFIQNLTGRSGASFWPVTQAPPSGGPNPSLGFIANYFAIQSTTNPSNSNLANTPYTDFGTDQAKIVFPEATNFAWASSGSGSWNNVGNWNGNWIPGSSVQDTVSLGAAIASNTATVMLDGNWAIGGLSFSTTGGGRYVLSRSAGDTTSTLTLAGSGASFSLSNSGSNLIAAPLFLANNLTVNVAAGSTLTASGSLIQSGSRSLAVTGGGKLVLSGSSNISGGTFVNAATLIVASPNAIASGTSLTVGNGWPSGARNSGTRRRARRSCRFAGAGTRHAGAPRRRGLRRGCLSTPSGEIAMVPMIAILSS